MKISKKIEAHNYLVEEVILNKILVSKSGTKYRAEELANVFIIFEPNIELIVSKFDDTDIKKMLEGNQDGSQ